MKNNRRKIGLFIIIMAMIFLVACSKKAMEPKFVDTSFDKDAVVTESDIESIIEYGEFKIAIHYPKTDNDQINQILKQYAETKVSEFKKNVREREAISQNELNINFKTYKFNDEIISFKFDEYTMILGDANGENVIETMTFNLSNAHQYQIGEILDGPDTADILSKKVFEGLEKNDVYKSNDNELEMLKEGTAPNLENFKHFALDSEKLILFFETYQIGSRSNPINKFEIPWSELSDQISAVLDPAKTKQTQQTTVTTTTVLTTAATHTTKKTVNPGNDHDGKKLIAITFDDGPDKNLTPELLGILEKNNVKATFFMLGQKAQYYPSIVKQVNAAGHQVGSHTFDHKDLSKLSEDQIREEINSTSKIIKNIIGKNPDGLRPPYGALNDVVKKNANNPIILWSIDPQDWKFKDADKVASSVISSAKDGDIILLHDIHPTSVHAAGKIIPALKAQGFEFVTVDELLTARGGKANGKVYYRAK